jgi:hypothetical protein
MTGGCARREEYSDVAPHLLGSPGFRKVFAMIRRALILLTILPTFALAEDFKGYRTTTLDAVIDKWNRETASEGPGISFSRPEKIKFVVTMREAPKPCNVAVLRMVLKMMDFADLLKQVGVTHCIALSSAKGAQVVAYLQDVLVPGFNTDVTIGRPLDIYADFLAFEVNADRSRNMPIMLVSEFEPR